MKIAKCRLFAGGKVGQETETQRREHAERYLELLKKEGETILETYEENGYLIIKMQD